jgi:hypothetical protein
MVVVAPPAAAVVVVVVTVIRAKGKKERWWQQTCVLQKCATKALVVSGKIRRGFPAQLYQSLRGRVRITAGGGGGCDNTHNQTPSDSIRTYKKV